MEPTISVSQQSRETQRSSTVSCSTPQTALKMLRESLSAAPGVLQELDRGCGDGKDGRYV